MKRKKLKIKGITGGPLFLVRFHGWLDGKRGAVSAGAEGWQGCYLDGKRAIYSAYVHKTYTKLEESAAPLQTESAALVMEHEDLVERLRQPEGTAGGETASIRERNAARRQGERRRLEERKREIELRLATIQELLIHQVSDAAGVQREAAAQTQRRLMSYCHGASLAMKTTWDTPPVEVCHPFQEQEDFLARHQAGTDRRQALLEQVLEGGDPR